MDPEEKQERINLAMTGEVNEAGKFEVLAIPAGDGNGWKFGADTLRRSLALWDGVECFVDHGSMWSRGRSVRDLAGVFSAPTWDEAAQGVRLQLEASGPSGALLESLGREMLKDGKKKPKVGFSADVGFSAKAQEVMEIMRVFSVDLVFNPARGGAFVRALNSVMPEGQPYGQKAKQGDASMDGEGQEETQASKDLAAVRTLLDVQQQQAQLAQEAEAARAVRVQMCAYMLDSGLAASKLPQPMQEQIRKQFAGVVFDPSQLTQAIDDGRNLVSALTSGSAVQGPRITGMFDSRDQLQAAVDDMLDAERDAGSEKLKAARLSGIRELYLTLTGDYDLHGGYYPDRARLATTADFTGLVKNALNKIVVNQWKKLGQAGYDWWTRIAVQEHFNSLNQITGTLIGTVGALPVVAEAGPYTELEVGDSPEVASFVKYGGYIPLTLELIDRDETRKLKAYPKELASAGLRKVSALVAALFTANAGVGPTLADTGALFNATAVTDAGGAGHGNLLTTALDAAEWETVCQAVYNQPMLIKHAAGLYGTGPAMAINPRYLLVPRALQLTGMKILYPSLENATSINSENQQRGQPGDVITVPEWTDAKDFAAVCDPAIAPAVFVGERFGIMPEIFIAGDETNGAVFTNDEHRLKVRHFLAVWVNDFRPLHKSNVV
jgi:hypothetical protein